MRYITPTLDRMYANLLEPQKRLNFRLIRKLYAFRFMDSLQWVDQTNAEKHKSEDASTLRDMYYPNLSLYASYGEVKKRKRPQDAAYAFGMRFGKRAAISLAIYLLSYLPLVGRFVLPAASFYTLNKALGPLPATVIFGSGIFLPRKYLVVFLQTYFSSRSLMRELVRLLSTFSSIPNTNHESLPPPSAGTLLLPSPLHQTAKTPLVPRPGRPPIWLRRRLLHLPQNSPSWRSHLRHCRSLDCLSHHQDHRSPTPTG